MNKYAVINVDTARKCLNVIDADFSTLNEALLLAQKLSWIEGRNLVLIRVDTKVYGKLSRELKFFTILDCGEHDYYCNKYFVTEEEAIRDVQGLLNATLIERHGLSLFNEAGVYMEVCDADEV